MQMMIQTGPVVLALEELFPFSQTRFMGAWKLDPFLCDPQKRTDLQIRRLTSAAATGTAAAPSFLPMGKSIPICDEAQGFFNTQVYESPEGYDFRYVRRSNDRTMLRYHVSPDWKQINLVEDESESAGQLAFEYLIHILPAAMLSLEVLTFHGVLLEYEGKGIILSAPSGVGKTTHARLWTRHKRAIILNGDKSAVYKKDGIWTGFGMPWSGSSGEYMNREVPIAAHVILERGEHNQAEKCPAFDAFSGVLAHLLSPRWNTSMMEKSMDLLEDYLSHVPVYRLRCRPDVEAVEVLQDCIFETDD